MKDYVLAPLVAGTIIGIVVYLSTISKDDYCRWAARDESALEACQADANCRSTPKDWERFQRDTRRCLAR